MQLALQYCATGKYLKIRKFCSLMCLATEAWFGGDFRRNYDRTIVMGMSKAWGKGKVKSAFFPFSLAHK